MAGRPRYSPWLTLFAADRGEITRTPTLNELPARFAVAAVIVSTTTAAVAIAAVAAAIAAKAATATTAILARFGFVDFQRPSIDFLAVELLNRCCAFFFRGHFDEGEPS